MAVRATITSKLMKGLAPLHLEVLNESYQHNVPKGSETHFRVVIVSYQFDGKTRIQQHRMVQSILADELKNGVHALAIQTTPSSKWNSEQPPTASPSPQCLGGMKRELKDNERKE